MSGIPIRQPIKLSRFTLKIPLTQGQFAIIDAEDWPKISNHNWCATQVNGKWYASARQRPKVLLMHRVVMAAKSGQDVDHRDVINTLDNRKSNLRFCTRRQGLWNKRRHSDGSSIYKGVTFTKNGWMARISENNRHHFLGYFVDPASAAKTYDRAARKYHGEFAYLNFPGEK